MYRTFLLSAVLLVFLALSPVEQFFHSQKVVGTITDDRLVEVSGLDQAHANPGYFWTHNDSGSKPILYLINQVGEIKMEVRLEGIKNRDWEEIVTVKKGDKSFIYVAEIGDNKAVHDEVRLIRLEEPIFEGDAKVALEFEALRIMNFQYAEGARDAEAVLYDYNFDEFVLVTKREENPLVYAFNFEESKEPKVISSKGTLPTKLFTAADMNESGEILLKHYNAIYFWGKSNARAVDRILDWNPININYEPEPQGEAMCWYNKNFYTISEKNRGKPQEMQFFKRLD